MTDFHPQSVIETIGKNGCLAMCYLYCAGIDNCTNDYFKCILDGMDRRLIQRNDCTVLNADKFIFAESGKLCIVSKKAISDLSEIREKTPVQFYCKGITPHWVVVENGKIVFNPLSYSISVDKGAPVDARIIKWV